MNKNILSDLTFTDAAQLDIFTNIEGRKNIFLDNTSPLKYSILAKNANIDIDVNTTRDGSE